MLTRYLTGTPVVQAVLAVNLANQKGSEGTLGRTFKQEAERYAKVKPGFEVVSFDFHHECKGMRYDRCAPQSYIIAEPNRSLALASHVSHTCQHLRHACLQFRDPFRACL